MVVLGTALVEPGRNGERGRKDSGPAQRVPRACQELRPGYVRVDIGADRRDTEQRSDSGAGLPEGAPSAATILAPAGRLHLPEYAIGDDGRLVVDSSPGARRGRRLGPHRELRPRGEGRSAPWVNGFSGYYKKCSVGAQHLDAAWPQAPGIAGEFCAVALRRAGSPIRHASLMMNSFPEFVL